MEQHEIERELDAAQQAEKAALAIVERAAYEAGGLPSAELQEAQTEYQAATERRQRLEAALEGAKAAERIRQREAAEDARKAADAAVREAHARLLDEIAEFSRAIEAVGRHFDAMREAANTIRARGRRTLDNRETWHPMTDATLRDLAASYCKSKVTDLFGAYPESALRPDLAGIYRDAHADFLNDSTQEQAA